MSGSAGNRALNSSDFQSSSDSEAQSSFDSEFQSSTDSQKTRAFARSKLMEEAKRKAELLLDLRPQFDKMVKQFSEKVRNDNKMIFYKWEILFVDLPNCTDWVPSSRHYLKLRLQNPPGQDGMFQVIPRMIFLTQFYSDG